MDFESETLIVNGRQDPLVSDVAQPLDGDPASQVLVFDSTQVTTRTNRSNPQPGDPCHALSSQGHPPAIAFRGAGQEGFTPSEVSPPLCNTDGGQTVPTIAYNLRGREGGAQAELTDVASLRSSSGGSSRTYVGVRRLTPTECERLQGFEDSFTAIPFRGKSAKDGPRYKALGNSMAVPVVRWILTRLAHRIAPAGLRPETNAISK